MNLNVIYRQEIYEITEQLTCAPWRSSVLFHICLEEEMASVLDKKAESYRFNSTLGQHSSRREKNTFVGTFVLFCGLVFNVSII
jgi:hypothetical protein